MKTHKKIIALSLFFILILNSCSKRIMYENVSFKDQTTIYTLNSFLFIESNDKFIQVKPAIIHHKLESNGKSIIFQSVESIYLDTIRTILKSSNHKSKDSLSIFDSIIVKNNGNYYYTNLLDFYQKDYIEIADTLQIDSKSFILFYQPSILTSHGKLPTIFYFMENNITGLPTIIGKAYFNSNMVSLEFNIKKEVKISLKKARHFNNNGDDIIEFSQLHQSDTTLLHFPNYSEINNFKGQELDKLKKTFEIEILKLIEEKTIIR